MRSTNNILMIICLAGLFIFSAGVQESSASGEKRIFIVHSYEEGHICGQPQHDGAIKALEEAGWKQGEKLEVGVYHMDTKRKNNTPELIAEQAEKAEEAIANFKPDVVYTLDDNAFRTIALPSSGSTVSYVFSGLNGQPETYNKKNKFMEDRLTPGGNITGVYEKLYIREAIHVLSSMHEMKSVLVLGDYSPTGRAIAKQVELELSPDQDQPSLPCKTQTRMMNSWEEFTKTINDINEDPEIGAIYLGTLLLKDSNNNTYTAPDIIGYTIKHARKPAIGLNYAFIKLGLYGGATVDFYAMGQLAGEKIAQILNGEKAGTLPIEDAPKVALVFNLKRAESLGMLIPNDILVAADEVFRK